MTHDPAGHKRLTREMCPECRHKGCVMVVRVRRHLAALLQWRCRDCGEEWTGLERRTELSA